METVAAASLTACAACTEPEPPPIAAAKQLTALHGAAVAMAAEDYARWVGTHPLTVAEQKWTAAAGPAAIAAFLDREAPAPSPFVNLTVLAAPVPNLGAQEDVLITKWGAVVRLASIRQKNGTVTQIDAGESRLYLTAQQTAANSVAPSPSQWWARAQGDDGPTLRGHASIDVRTALDLDTVESLDGVLELELPADVIHVSVPVGAGEVRWNDLVLEARPVEPRVIEVRLEGEHPDLYVGHAALDAQGKPLSAGSKWTDGFSRVAEGRFRSVFRIHVDAAVAKQVAVSLAQGSYRSSYPFSLSASAGGTQLLDGKLQIQLDESMKEIARPSIAPALPPDSEQVWFGTQDGALKVRVTGEDSLPYSVLETHCKGITAGQVKRKGNATLVAKQAREIGGRPVCDVTTRQAGVSTRQLIGVLDGRRTTVTFFYQTTDEHTAAVGRMVESLRLQPTRQGTPCTGTEKPRCIDRYQGAACKDGIWHVFACSCETPQPNRVECFPTDDLGAACVCDG